MKKSLLLLSLVFLVLVSCSKKTILDTYAPEERALNLTKITNEANATILGGVHGGGMPSRFAATVFGGNKKAKIHWITNRMLDISPDGQQVAYQVRKDKQDNVMISSAFAPGAATQRTFRNVLDFSWGADGKFYFADFITNDNVCISSIDSQVGTVVRQHTSGNLDRCPVVTDDGRVLFFTRIDRTGPSVWAIDMVTGVITNCALGYNPCIVPGKNDQFYCVRNNSAGNSEIYQVEYKIGRETMVLSDQNRSFTNPIISPDGQWLVVQANAKSNLTKKDNLDIFVARTDGTDVRQLTTHPGDDCSPIFSPDGRSIYFLSTRANKDERFNVWRMDFRP